MSKKTRFIISLIILIIVSVGGFYYYNNIYLKNKYLSKETQEIIKENKKIYVDKGKIPKPTQKEDPKQETNYVNNLPTHRKNANNPYILGELNIPGIKLDVLITRAKNNSYYLDHNLYNQYDVLGNPFFDFRNTNLANNQQINIYGHNTENEKYLSQVPFSKLEAYADKATFEVAKDVYLNIDEKSMKYKVIAVKIISHNDNEHTKIAFSGTNDFLNHTNKLLSNTVYIDNSETLKGNDRLLVLQACHYQPRGSYLLIISKEV